MKSARERAEEKRQEKLELVREQVLSRTREEVPHAVEVEIENIEEHDGKLKSFAHVDHAGARAQAKRAEKAVPHAAAKLDAELRKISVKGS